MKKTGSGFTLIELLVVIGIIAILVGILMPALGRARQHGWSAKCKINLRNLHVASMNHATDHGGWFPLAGSVEEASWIASDDPEAEEGEGSYGYRESPGWVHWVEYPAYPAGQDYHNESHADDQDVKTPWWNDPDYGDYGYKSLRTGTLWDYLGHQPKVYLCPRFAAGLWSGTSPASDKIADDGPPVRSYVMNSYFGDRDGGSRRNFQNEANANVSKRLMFADSQPDRTFEGRNFRRWFKQTSGSMHERRRAWDGSLNFGSDTNNPTEVIGTVHFGRGNAVFLDGHVEELTWQDTVSRCNATW